MIDAAGNGAVTTAFPGHCVFGIVNMLIGEFRWASDPKAMNMTLDKLKSILLRLHESVVPGRWPKS